MLKTILDFISHIAIAVAIAGGVWFAVTELSKVQQQAVINEARYQCASSSRYTTKDAPGVEVWYPVPDLYQKCLAEKNIQ